MMSCSLKHSRRNIKSGFCLINRINFSFSATLKSIAVLSGALVIFSTPCRASENIDPKLVQETEGTAQSGYSDVQKFIYGKPPKDGIIFQPIGFHTKTIDKRPAHNSLIGMVYHSFSAGTFINSFDDRTWYFVVMRNIYSEHGFGIGYMAGALYGYKGNLSTVNGVPFRHTLLFEHNINPIIAIDAWYEVTDSFHLQATFTPLVVLVGVKYNF